MNFILMFLFLIVLIWKGADSFMVPFGRRMKLSLCLQPVEDFDILDDTTKARVYKVRFDYFNCRYSNLCEYELQLLYSKEKEERERERKELKFLYSKEKEEREREREKNEKEREKKERENEKEREKTALKWRHY
jgi:hypothetical protein